MRALKEPAGTVFINPARYQVRTICSDSREGAYCSFYIEGRFRVLNMRAHLIRIICDACLIAELLARAKRARAKHHN